MFGIKSFDDSINTFTLQYNCNKINKFYMHLADEYFDSKHSLITISGIIYITSYVICFYIDLATYEEHGIDNAAIICVSYILHISNVIIEILISYIKKFKSIRTIPFFIGLTSSFCVSTFDKDFLNNSCFR